MRKVAIKKLVEESYNKKKAAKLALSYYNFIQNILNCFITLEQYSSKLTLINIILQLRIFSFKI
jgi:hypothetical protein